MRAPIVLATALILLVCGACSQLVTQEAATQARNQFAKCGAQNRVTPEGLSVAGRLWMGDASDTAAKLLDPYPLTPAERAALVQLHNRAVQCRQIIVAHAEKYSQWSSPFFQEYIQRADEIYGKLVSGELPVGMANKLTIENDRKLKLDLASGHLDDAQSAGVRADEDQREKAVDAMLAASAQVAAAQPAPRLPTTYCNWQGNTLNCASLHQ